MIITKNFTGSFLSFLITCFVISSCKNSREKIPVFRIKKKTEHTVGILPFSDVDTALLSKIKKGIQNKLDVLITVLDPDRLPEFAFYKPRQRYIADSLLVFLGQKNNRRFEKIIGITVKDISTRKEPHENWGILGLGYCPGEACVISTFRAGKKKVAEKDFNRRMITLALHELGHTYGLEHCPVTTCLMKDAQGKMNLDNGDMYCDRCSNYLRTKAILSSTTLSEK